MTIPTWDHIVYVWMENESSTGILGSSSAPYINSLANANAVFTKALAEAHPSQPNYLAGFAGSTMGISDDNDHDLSGANLYTQLKAAGLTFKAYSQDLPSAGYTGTSAPGSVSGQSASGYARKHAPWVSFQVNGYFDGANHVPLTSLPTSNYSLLPRVSWIAPNLWYDMHDSSISVGDSWLQANLDPIVVWAKSNNSLVILVWDEDDSNSTNGNDVAMIFAGANIQPGTYTQVINHYDVLGLIQDANGLARLNNTVGLASMNYLIAASSSGSPSALPYTESFTGTTGAAWPSGWTLRASAGSTATIQSNAGRILTGATAYATAREDLTGMTGIVDSDITGTVVMGATGVEQYAAVSVDGDGGSNNETPNNSYALVLNYQGGSMSLRSTIGGTRSTVATASRTLTGTTVYSFRLRRSGSTLTARVWTGTEPTAWDLTATLTDTSATGIVGLGISNGSDGVARSATFDNVTVTDLGNSGGGSTTSGGGGSTALPYTDAFAGTDGAAWSNVWTRVGLGASATIQGNAGRITAPSAGTYGVGRSDLTGMPTVGDTDITGTVVMGATGVEQYVAVSIDSDGSTTNDASNNSYALTFDYAGGALNLRTTIAGTRATVATTARTLTGTTVYSFRLQRIGRSLRARVWTGAEPGTWDLTATLSGTPLTGIVALSVSNGSNATARTATFDNVTVAVPTAGWSKAWTGTDWVPKPVKMWNGSAWVVKPVKRWTGSAWVPVNSLGRFTVPLASGTGPLVTGSWNLVFRDEFDASTLDTTVWSTDEGNSMNNTTVHASNVSVANSCAVLMLASSTSGAQISTQNALFQVGDYVEFRALFPGDGIGLYNWPAVWTSGPNWPMAGEIDIAEVLGNSADDNNITVNYHHGATAGADTANNYGTPATGYWGDQFHTFGAVRKASTFDIYWDGVKVLADKPTADNGSAQSIIATMGTHISSGPNQAGKSLLVDYVRLYRPA